MPNKVKREIKEVKEAKRVVIKKPAEAGFGVYAARGERGLHIRIV